MGSSSSFLKWPTVVITRAMSINENNEKAQLIMRAIQQLPEEQRTVLILKEYEGLKFREIAATLDISENTAKSRLYYGLKALRKMSILSH